MGAVLFVGFGVVYSDLATSDVILSAVVLWLGWMSLVLVWLTGVTAVLRVGLPSLLLNAARSMRGAVSALECAGRALPIVFAVLFVAFFTGDVWRTVNVMSWPRFALTMGLLVLFNVVAAALAARSVELPVAKRQPLSRGGLMLEGLSRARGVKPWNNGKLSDAQKRNLQVALASAVLGRLLLVCFVAGVAFVLLGAVAVGGKGHTVFLAKADPHEVALGLHWEMLGMSALLGAVAALTFGAGALSSKDQRVYLVDDQAARLSSCLDEWRFYAPLAEERARR